MAQGITAAALAAFNETKSTTIEFNNLHLMILGSSDKKDYRLLVINALLYPDDEGDTTALVDVELITSGALRSLLMAEMKALNGDLMGRTIRLNGRASVMKSNSFTP